MDASGNIYGTTLYSGDNDAGTVFELSLVNGTWTYTTIFAAFPSDGGNCTDLGCGPQGRLLSRSTTQAPGTSGRPATAPGRGSR